MAAIFISYRRVGALVHARALYERLSHDFGRNEVFIDLEGIEYGVDFVDVLNEQLNGCKVMLALIDAEWATAVDRQGRRRLDREYDFVRIEIVTALSRGIRTVPVLLDGTEMPDAEMLPEPLRPLSRRNALNLDFNRFDAEIVRLEAAIRKILAQPDDNKPRPGAIGPTHGVVNEQQQADQQAIEVPAAASDALIPPALAKKGAASKSKQVTSRKQASAAPKRESRPPHVDPAVSADPGAPIPARGPGPDKPARLPAGDSFGESASALERQAPPDALVPVSKSNRMTLPTQQANSSALVFAKLRQMSATKIVVSMVLLVGSTGLLLKISGLGLLWAGYRFKDCNVCPEMVVIPEGRFNMGSPPAEPEREKDEGPQHPVSVPRFAMAETEVTFEEWDACAAAAACSVFRPGDEGWGRGRRPVINVSWDDAQGYLLWLKTKTGRDYRLPSEAEWEYAARGGSTTAYWWGETVGSGNANCSDCGSSPYKKQTAPVKSFTSNAFGLFDMGGNVWQWLADCYHENYDGAPVNGSAWENGDSCAQRVVRGSSWADTARFVRSAGRYNFDHGNIASIVGFRVARSLP